MSDSDIAVGGATAEQIRTIIREELEPVKQQVDRQGDLILAAISSLAVRFTRLEKTRSTDEVAS